MLSRDWGDSLGLPVLARFGADLGSFSETHGSLAARNFAVGHSRVRASNAGVASLIPGEPGQEVQASFRLEQRDARYRNEVGLFLVDDATGRIGGLHPGDRGYAVAALSQRIVMFTRDQPRGATSRATLPGGRMFGTYLVRNSSAEQFLAPKPAGRRGPRPIAFFSFAAANPDRVSHMRVPSGDAIRMEDQWRGGDRDYNDAVIRFQFGTPTTPRPTPVPSPVRPSDNNPPVVTIASPASGLLTRRDVAVDGRVTDDMSGVARLSAEIARPPGASAAGGVSDVPFDAITGNYRLPLGLAQDGSADGPYTVVLRATDKAGNVSLPALVSFVLDATRPTVAVTTPIAGLTTNMNVEVAGRVADALSGVATMTAQVDGKAPTAVVFDGSGGFRFPLTLPLDGTADGDHAVTLRATDKAGNESLPATILLTLDATRPLVVVASPAPNLPTRVDVAVAGRTSDNLSGVVTLRARVDDGAEVPVTFDQAGNYNFATDLAAAALLDGPHTIHLRATDKAGNVSVLADLPFTLDRVAPTIGVSAPAEGLLTRGPVTVSGTVADERSGVVSLEGQVDGGTFAAVAFDPATGSFALPSGLVLDGSADGPHAVVLRATDRAGNVSAPVTRRFTLDTTAPAVSLALDPASDTAPTGDSATYLTPVTLSGQTEAGLVVSLVETGGVTTADAAGLFRFVGVALPMGTTTFTARATDAAGNVGTGARPITRVERCGFEEGLDGWATGQSGGSTAAAGGVTLDGQTAILREGDSFRVTLEESFVVPANPGSLKIEFADLSFDGTDPSFINDAFEAAMVDASGNPLVHTFAAGRDAFFNITEGQPAATGSETTASGQVVTVDLSGVLAGTTARLIFRLVNNDSDTATSVRLTCVLLPDGSVRVAPAPGGGTGEDPGGSPARSALATPGTTPVVLVTAAAALAPPPSGGGGGGPAVDPPLPGDRIPGEDGRAVYTTTADFESGTQFNTNTTAVADQLNLDPPGEAQTFPFIWVSNADEGTISRFDTRTGKEIGRYRTGPESIGARLSPSRTAVAGDGSVWVANRAFGLTASTVHILLTDFVDRNGNGVLDTSSDRNGNGKIDADEILPWDANNDGRPDDERIALSVAVGRNRSNPSQVQNDAIARSISIDANDDVWVGLFNLRQYEVYDHLTGALMGIVPVPGTPYGSVVDGNGQLWGATRGNFVDHIDTKTRTYVDSPNAGPGGNYGITIDGDGVLWVATYETSSLVRLDPATRQVNTYATPGIGNYRGVGVDHDRNVWVATNSPDRLVKLTFDADHKTLLRTDAVVVGRVASAAVIDADGFVWTTTYGDNLAWKIDPRTLQVVQGWPIATGKTPYNYSDMTGQVRLTVTKRTGIWTDVLDGGRPGVPWGGVELDAKVPAGATVRVRLRASDTRGALEGLAWSEVPPGQSLAGIRGRYLQAELTLGASAAAETPFVREFDVASVPVPVVTVEPSSADGKVEAGRAIVLGGMAVAGTPSLGGGVRVRNSIVYATIDGRPVDAIDGAGRFFARIDVLPGRNVLTIAATDAYGQVGTTTLTIDGEQASGRLIDFANVSDVSASFAADYARTSLDERKGTLYADAAIRNAGQYPIDAPLFVGVTNVSDPTVRVRDAAGTTPAGVPYYDFTGLVTGGRLDPTGRTGTLSLAFSDPNRARFTYDLVFFGLLNRAPQVTTVPVLESVVGRPYAYDVDATDPDRDPLTYSLVAGPAGMAVDAATGRIAWTPIQADLGTHDVTVRVDDGRGGSTEQRFAVATIQPPPNRPPVFTSTPIVTVTARSAYSYPATAADADGDLLTFSVTTGVNGLAIDAATGAVRWTPTLDQVGPHPISLAVSDGKGGAATQEFTLLVLPDPTFTPPPAFDLTVAGVDPAGLLYDGQLLTISGTVAATVTNLGTSDLGRAFDVLFFEDRDFNKAFDPAIDAVLGKVVVASEVKAGQGIVVSTELSGSVLFAGNVVWAFVDSEGAVAETDESNNLTPSGRDCVFIPQPGSFDPVVEWKRDSFGVLPTSNQVLSTPAVIDLNADGVPDIVFSTYVGQTWWNTGTLRAISGDDGRDLWTVTNSSYRVDPLASFAVGDIDGDGKPEIVAVHESGALITFENDGTFKWKSPVIPALLVPPYGGGFGGPSLADLDGDGKPELIAGATVINNDGTFRWRGDTASGRGIGFNAWGSLSIVADLDLDGKPEVIAGKTAYRNDGSVYWNSTIPDGLTAIGNFNADAFPEVAVVASGSVYLLDHAGKVLWGPVAIPGGGYGGAPTIADMDGDGKPDIGVAGATRYVVFNPDGTIKWQSPTQDASSNVTGSSVFDFEGDGKAEVIYGDELYLRIYRGSDGKVLYQLPKSSATAFELPVIADVDGDGHAEIVAVANNAYIPGQTGIYVIGDLNGTWVPTRAIWNQHSYHVTNVNDDGTIPRNEANSWQVSNTYRQNTQTTTGDPHAAPDLLSSYVRVAVAGADATITARIGNAGAVFQAPGMFVTFYDGDPKGGGVRLGTVKTTTRLEPGGYEDVSLIVPAASLTDVWIAADDDGTGRGRVGECDEVNNLYHSFTGLPSSNRPPAITSIPVALAAEGSAYAYDVMAADPDGDPLTFSLRTAPAGMTIDAATGAIRWTPTAGQSGRRAVQVIADDGRHGRAAQNFVVDVAESLNTPPRFTTTPPAQAVVGRAFTYAALAVDAEGDPLTFDLVVAPEGMTVGTSTGRVDWVTDAAQLGPQDVILRVGDGKGGIDLQSFRVQVARPNNGPDITSTPLGPASVGRPYEYQVRAQDADGDALAFRLDVGPAGMSVDAATGLLTYTPTAAQVGTRRVVVAVDDGHGAVTTQGFDLPVVSVATDRAPAITSTPRGTTRLGSPYLYLVEAADPDGDPLTYSLDQAPTGMTIGPDGLVTWEPAAAQFGANGVKVRVDDGRGGTATQQFSVNVVATGGNAPPTITSNPPQAGTAGRAYRYDAVAEDPDGDPLAWSFDSAPPGMSIDPATGAIRWLPGLDQLGPRTVAVRVTDAQGGFATQRFSIVVRGVNLPPSIASAPPTAASVGRVYAYAARATDPDGDPLTFSLTAAPTGMAIDAEAGVIFWAPAAGQEGSRAVKVRVADGQGGFADQSFTIVVSAATEDRPPSITSRPPFVATVGQPYGYQVVATDPEGAALTFSTLAAPDGLTIDAVTGLVSWTPAVGQLGANALTVAATDPAGNAATQTFTITTLGPNRPPAITSTPPSSVTAGLAFRYDVRANDPDRDMLSYRLAVAPPGMTVDDLGRIAWSTKIADIGRVHAELVVDDGRGGMVTQPFDLDVVADAQAPSVSLSTRPNPADLGATVMLIVSGTDDVGIASLTLSFDGKPVALDAAGRATVVASRIGLIEAVATAADAAGNLGRARVDLTVLDPSDAEAPVVSIAGLDEGQVFTHPTDVIGTVADAGLLFYTLESAPIDGGRFTEFARGTAPVDNGPLGRFDPTLLANGNYIIRLTAHDAGGHVSTLDRAVSVAGDLKLGNFSLSFTDLAIPVSGIPITVTRTYDTLYAGMGQEFGYGWRLEIGDTDLVTNVSKTGFEEDGFYNPFRDGTRVYVTVAGGKREGFTFRPRNTSIFIIQRYAPEFVPDPGVTDRLSVDHFDLRRLDDGSYTDFYGSFPYNPANSAFGGHYTLTTKQGIVYNIDGDTGDTNRIADANQNALRFSPAGIFSDSGQKVTFERDAQGRITAVIDPAGGAIHYQYDDNGDLAKVVDRAGNATTFAYKPDRLHYLDKVIDALGRTGLKTEYDADGRLAKVTGGDGNSRRLLHDRDRSLEIVVDGLNNATTFGYDDRGNVVVVTDALGGVTRRTYDLSNNLLSETDPLGNTVRFTYDGRGNVLTFADATGKTWRSAYDGGGRLTSESDPLGRTTRYEYDAKGNQTATITPQGARYTYRYDSRGGLTEMIDAIGGVTKLTRAANGQISGYIDPDGNAGSIEYHPNGPVSAERFEVGGRSVAYAYRYDGNSQMTGITLPNGQTASATYGPGGLPTGATNTRGDSQRVIYDANGQFTRFTDFDGSALSYQRDANGRITGVIGPGGQAVERTLDALGRPVAVALPQGQTLEARFDASGRVVGQKRTGEGETTTEYDAAGRPVRSTMPDGGVIRQEWDDAGQLIAFVNPLGQRVAFSYDQDGNLAATRFPDGTVSRSEFDALGRLVAFTDERGARVRYEFDPAGRLVAVTDSTGGRNRYEYDAMGNLVAAQTSGGSSWSFTYDLLGAPLSQTFPWGGTETLTRDSGGLITRLVDATNAPTDFQYDARGRLVSRTFADGTVERRTYDSNGQLVTATGRDGTTTYQYEDGVLARIDRPGASFIDYERDPANRIGVVSTPHGSTTYTYDGSGRLIKLSDSVLGVATYAYDLAGRLASITLPDRSVTTIERNSRGWAARVRTLAVDGSVLRDQAITYDAVGNPLRVVEPGREVVYTYDAAGRVASEVRTGSDAASVTYSYDGEGNLTRNEGRTLSFDETMRLTGDGKFSSYTYDEAGRPIRRSNGTVTETFTYDSLGRLIRVDRTGATPSRVDLEYDESNLIRRISVDGVARRLLWDTSQDIPTLLEETTDSGGLLRRYIHGLGPVGVVGPGGADVLHLDGLGSIRLSTGIDGRVLGRYAYSAYGDETVGASAPQDSLRYAGQYYMPELGLYFLRTRFYDPSAGRFLTPDNFQPNPVAPRSYNPYLYAAGNPVSFTDPLGTFSLGEISIALNIVGVLASIAVPHFPHPLAWVAQALGFRGDKLDLGIIGISVSFTFSRGALLGGLQVDVLKGPTKYQGIIWLFAGGQIPEPDPRLSSNLLTVWYGAIIGKADTDPTDPVAGVYVAFSGTFARTLLDATLLKGRNRNTRIVPEWSRKASSVQWQILGVDRNANLSFDPAFTVYGSSFADAQSAEIKVKKLTKTSAFGSGISLTLYLPLIWFTYSPGQGIEVDNWFDGD